MDPTPRSLILDLLSTLGRGSAPVRALVSAAALFGISGNRLRVALARLHSEGLVTRDRRGRYRLGPKAAALHGEIRSWRRVEEGRVRWSGGWVAVHTGRLSRGGARERRERGRALRVLGLQPFGPGLALRPDNLRGGVAAVRRRLEGLGLSGPGLVFCLDGLDDLAQARAEALWSREELERACRETRARLQASAARLPELPRPAAMAEAFRLGGAAIRQIVLDPLLPERIVPGRERRALVAVMRRYDALGRGIWAGWLGAGESEPRVLPAGVGAGATDAVGTS